MFFCQSKMGNLLFRHQLKFHTGSQAASISAAADCLVSNVIKVTS